MTGTIKRTTANYNLRIPIFDAPGWGRELERNFDIVDAVVFAFSGFGVSGVWTNGTHFAKNDRLVDPTDSSIWLCLVEHTSAATGTFEEDRIANPTYWRAVSNLVQALGQWQSGYDYRTNDYIYDEHRYGVVLHNFTSGASYDDDVANGDILTLVDLSGDLSTTQAAASTASSAAITAVDAKDTAVAAKDIAVAAKDDAEQSASDLFALYTGFAGGTSAQALVKASNNDYDFQWVTLPGGGDMLSAIYDPQGIGADAFARANHTGEQDISTITGLQTALDDLDQGVTNSVPKTRTITAGTGLSGGGDLSNNISISVSFGTVAGTVAQGNDSRIVDALSIAKVHALTSKAPPADADEFVIADSAASWIAKKLTWSAIKSALASIFLSKSGGTITGPITKGAVQTTAIFGDRSTNNQFEFGASNPAGYGSTIGNTSPHGRPFVAFSAESVTGGTNLFRTRGRKGSVFAGDLNGGFTWNTVPVADADNQALVQTGALDSSGNFTISGKLTVGAAPTANMDVATKQYVDNGIASKAGFYTGSAVDNTNFPIGSIIAVGVGANTVNRNATPPDPIRIFGAGTDRFVLTGAYPALSGTWRARGQCGTYSSGSSYFQLFQRTA